MIVIYCMNKKGQRFEKVFNDFHKAKVFILRCRYGKSVFIEGYETYNQEIARELAYYC